MQKTDSVSQGQLYKEKSGASCKDTIPLTSHNI